MKKFAVLIVAALAPALIAQPALARPRHQQQQAEKQPDKNAYESPFPTKMNWTLSSINGKPAPADASLRIDETLRGSGLSGCNSWSATLYPVRGHKLAMGPVAMTKKTCSPAINMFERQYLTILHTGPNWDLNGSTLTIKSQAGTLVFHRGL